MILIEPPQLAKIIFGEEIPGLYGLRMLFEKESLESTEVLKAFHRKLFFLLKPYQNENNFSIWRVEFKEGVNEEQIKEIVDNLAKEMLVKVIYS